jgi:hypothetical protein
MFPREGTFRLSSSKANLLPYENEVKKIWIKDWIDGELVRELSLYLKDIPYCQDLEEVGFFVGLTYDVLSSKSTTLHGSSWQGLDFLAGSH